MVDKTDLGEMNAQELLSLYKAHEASPVEVVKASFDRIDKYNPEVNAFAFVDKEAALKAAEESEKRWLDNRPAGPVDGIPTTIKELTAVIGMPSALGSKLVPLIPAKEEPLRISRLRQAGGVILGLTKSPEFGWKGLTHGPLNGNTCNPWNTARASGGSSGGAAAAAALNMGVLHEGSDAAGSVRIPASFCGVFGAKLTRGTIPVERVTHLRGLVHIGPLSRNMSDASLFMEVFAGASSVNRYGYCPPSLPNWKNIAENPQIKGLRVGYSKNLGYAKVEKDVASALDKVAQRLQELGAVVEEADPGFSNPQDALIALWFTSMAHIVDSFNPTDDMLDMLDKGLKKGIEESRSVTVKNYMDAEKTSLDISVSMANFHQKYDVLLLPTMPLTAFEAGVDYPDGKIGKDWTDWSPFTYPFNMTGQPAVTVPCGFDRDGLPIGAQLVGAMYNDATIWHMAAAYMEAFPEKILSSPNNA